MKIAIAATLAAACLAAQADPKAPIDELQAAQQEAAKLVAQNRAIGGLDTTPPVLKQFRVSGSVNAQKPDQSVDVLVAMSDDLSGIWYYWVQLTSPSGAQQINRYKTTPIPLLDVSSTLTVGAPYGFPGFTKYVEPGLWRATRLFAYDEAGNTVDYNAQQLVAFGNTTFRVTNTGGYDAVPPTLASGIITSPSVQMSNAPPGLPAGTPPFVSAQLNVTDAGNGVVSGAYAAILQFCIPDGNGGRAACFGMTGETNRTGRLANTMIVGGHLAVGQTLGTYEIYSINVYDNAQNMTNLYSNKFSDGDVDLSRYFASTTIVVGH